MIVSTYGRHIVPASIPRARTRHHSSTSVRAFAAGMSHRGILMGRFRSQIPSRNKRYLRCSQICTKLSGMQKLPGLLKRNRNLLVLLGLTPGRVGHVVTSLWSNTVTQHDRVSRLCTKRGIYVSLPKCLESRSVNVGLRGFPLELVIDRRRNSNNGRNIC